MIATKSYPVFQRNQSLTSAQLNAVTDYLDQQDRLTRACLIGIGIVCGLKIEFQDPVITITKGLGITSCGDLISLKKCDLKYVKDYSLATQGISYKPFEDASGKQDITLVELLENPDATTTPLLPVGDLADYCVLLFLQSRERSANSCIGKSCDSNGKERVIDIKRLLITKNDLNVVLSRTAENVSSLYRDKYDLRTFRIKRPQFNALQLEIIDYTDYCQRFLDTMDAAFLNDFFQELIKAYNVFKPLLQHSIPANHITQLSGDFLNQKLIEFSNYQNSIRRNFGIQYVCDFIKDLILAYDEFRETSFELMTQCIPNEKAFPKHLMLGEVLPAGVCKPTRFRHGFSQPPIFNRQKYLREKSVALFNRLVSMLENLDFRIFNEDSPNTVIRLTPSAEKKAPPSLRAIPYYYNINRAPHDLLSLWSFDLRRKCRHEENMRYDRDNSPLDFIRDPLLYDIDDYHFFRIEGHVGKRLEDVMQNIRAQVSSNNLPIDLIALKLGDDQSDIEIGHHVWIPGKNSDAESYRHHCFKDLQHDYFTDRYEYLTDLRQFATRIHDIIGFLTLVRQQLDSNFWITSFYNNVTKDLDELISVLNIAIDQVQRLNLLLPPQVWRFRFAPFMTVHLRIKQLAELIGAIVNEVLASDTLGRFAGLNASSLLRPFIEKISTDDLGERFKIHFAIFSRRSEKLKRLGLFHEFSHVYPGMEHLAGVYSGGTFVLVYTEAPVQPTQPPEKETPDDCDCDKDPTGLYDKVRQWKTDHVWEHIVAAARKVPKSEIHALAVMAVGTAKLYGRVVRKSDGTALASANVSWKGTTVGTVADLNGEFVLDLRPQGETSVLVISMIGCRTEEFSYEEISQQKREDKRFVFELTCETPQQPVREYQVIGDFALPYRICECCELPAEWQMFRKVQATDVDHPVPSPGKKDIWLSSVSEVDAGNKITDQ